MAVLDTTANTISLWEIVSGHLIYQIDLSHTKVDLCNIACWNLSHDVQKLVLVSSDWMMHVVCLPAYIQSYPRSLMIGSHMPREQLCYKNLHTCQTGDVVWREKLAYTGGVESLVSNRRQKNQGRQSDGYGRRKVSGFKKNMSSPVKADTESDTVIETFELPVSLSGHTVGNMVVGEYIVAMELLSSDSSNKALCLVDMTSGKNMFQSLLSNQHIVLSSDSSYPHMIISEQFLFHVIQPGFEQEDLVSKLMVYGGARSADTLCDMNKWSRCTVPLNALEIGLTHRQLDTVAFFLKSKENLFSSIKEKPMSPLSSVDETSLWQQPNCYQDNLQQLESALVLLVDAVQSNMANRQSQDFGNKLLTLTLDYLYGLLRDGLAVRSGLESGEQGLQEKEDIEKAIEIVMTYTAKLRQCLVSGTKETWLSEQMDCRDGGEDTEESKWKDLGTEEALEAATLENSVSVFQTHLISSGSEDNARFSKVVTHGITHVMAHLKRHDIEQARKMLLNLGFEVTPKLWELARFVHDRNIQTFVLQELQKSSGLNTDQSSLLAYLQQLFDHYPCSSFSLALLNKSTQTQSSVWSDDNPVAQCIIQKMPSFNPVCGDIGASDSDLAQCDGMYTEVLLDWLEWWDAETRERVLLDSDLSKPDFEVEKYANKTLLFKFLLSHNMHAETMRLVDCLLKELRTGPQRLQCQEILHSLTNQLHYCGYHLRDEIFTRLLRSGHIPEELLSDFPRLLRQLSSVGGVLQVPHPIQCADGHLQRFHQQFIKYCTATQLVLPLWRYCSLHRIHPNQFSMDDPKGNKWLSNFTNFFSVLKNPEDTQLMFAASLSNASLLWNLDDCSLADLFQEGHDLAAIATLPYYSPPVKQISGDQTLGSLLGIADTTLLESKLKAYPKLHAALYPESGMGTPHVDIDVYKLLVGNAPFDPRRLFGWQTTNSVVGEDCCKVLPYFSQPELVSKFAYIEKLRFPYYLKHCRPSYAFFSFLATEVESGAASISSKRIQTACGIALWIAVKNLTNQQIGSSCSAFVEMLGHESLLIRTYISVGLKLLVHRNSGVKGTAEKRKEICHVNEQDVVDLLVSCIQNRRRHGNKLLILIEEAIENEITRRKIERNTFEAGRKWFLAVIFCSQLGLPLTTTFLEGCAQADAWLPFIWFAQLHQYPKHQLQGLLHHFKSRHLRDHLHYVIENADVKSLLPPKKKSPDQQMDQGRDTRSSLYAKIGLAKKKDDDVSSEEDIKCSPKAPPVNASHSTSDADLHVSEDAAPEDVFQVVFSSQASRCPWKSLLFHSVFLRNMLFAELAACYQDSSLVACFCGWLVAMLDKPRNHQFLEDHGTTVCGWGITQLEALIDIYLEHKWEFTLAICFDIFQPNSPLLPFFKFIAECSQQRNYTRSKQFLEEFKDTMSNFSQRNKYDDLTRAVQPVVIGDQEWLEQTSSRILHHQLLVSCHLYDTLQLLRLLDLENIALVFSFDVADFGRLHKLAQILHSCKIEDINFQAFLFKSEQPYQTEALKAVTRLTERSYFIEARTFATLTNVEADFVTIKQMELEKQQLENSLLWKSKVSRRNFWLHCADSFTKEKICSSQVVEFFMNEAASVDCVHEKAMIYQLCLDQVSESDIEDTAGLQDEIYQNMWQCRIEAKIQTPEETLLASDPVEEIRSGIEMAEISKPAEDKGELLHFGRMPGSKQQSALSQQESDALSSLVGELLNKGQIRKACKVTSVFSHNSQDLAIILTCIRLSLHIQTVEKMEDELRKLLTSKVKAKVSSGSFSGIIPNFPHSASSLSLASTAPVWDFLSVEKEEVIITMEMLLGHCVFGRHCCLRIVTAYKVACILNRTYEEVVASNEFTVLGDLLKVTSFQQRFSLARDYLSTSSLSDDQVSAFLAEKVITDLKVCMGGHNEQESPRSRNQDLMFNPRDQFIKLCQDPSKLGNHLLDAVATMPANQTESSYTELSIQTELLILAHECFTVACSMEGISNVLRAARISTDVLVASQEFSLMIRLLTGVGRFSEMTYIFDALIHYEQFELLLRKGMEREDKLKIAILDYLKRFHPKDNENYTMVALNFTMYREIAQMLEENGRRIVELVKDKPLESTKEMQDVLKKSAVYYSDAADGYVKENCFRQAQQCIRQARLLALQLQHLSSGVILINLSPEGVTSFLNQHPKFSECLIVSEAYGKRANWVTAIYNNVIVNSDFRYLQDLKSHIGLTPTMIAEAVDRYQQMGSPSSQCIANIKKLLPYCKDVKTQYSIAKDLGLTDVISTMLKGESASYLQDIMSKS
ncbi:spatacsin-like [Gigantopelta aegis]|uniref:spatacsin-like n=1 Tax=Gigantopelta aegis TaxID=1735272 RepID=UPI001B889329|nr:spatacsin-like [Gigantopelta aegis]